MQDYKLSFFGKKIQVSKSTFITFSFFWLIFIFLSVWCMFGGVWRFGENYFNSGWLAVIPAMIIFGSIKINDINYSFLPENKFTKTMNRAFFWSAIFYYFYTIVNY